MTMPVRQYTALNSSYRYGFNGQEKSSELNESLYTAEYWQYDSRIGRRWNLDVVEKAWISGYATLNNSPIMMIDPDGADWYRNNKTKEAKWFDGNGKHKNYSYVGTDDEVTFKGKDLDEVVVSAKQNKYAQIIAAWRSRMAVFNHSAADETQWKISQDNFYKGNYSAIAPTQLSMYRQWDQANKESRTLSYIFVGGMAAPLVAVGAVETGVAGGLWNGGRWLIQQSIGEAGLAKEGMKWLGRKYGRSFITEVGINYLQNGMDIKKMDAFDIFTNTLNPYRSCLRGRVLMGGLNSLVDVNLFDANKPYSYLGKNKNFSQVGIDFSFGLFNEGMKYTFGTLGSENASRDFILDVITGNAGGQAQGFAEDKK